MDPTGDVRRGLARRVIADYYEPRIGELARQVRAQLEPGKGPIRRARIGGTEWELWRLEAECLHYHLKVGEQEGSAYFDDRFVEAQRNNHLMRMEFLLSEMEMARHPGIRDVLELRRAETLFLRGDVEQASEIGLCLLARTDLSLDHRISAHNVLGLIAAATDPEQARQQYEAALRLAQEADAGEYTHKASVIGVLHNNLGQLYQLTSRLNQAIQHYQQAIEYSQRAGNRPLVASATNNLAYVYRLQRRPGTGRRPVPGGDAAAQTVGVGARPGLQLSDQRGDRSGPGRPGKCGALHQTGPAFIRQSEGNPRPDHGL